MEKLKQCYKILPMLVFLVFLGVMAVLLFALPDKDYSPNEKRYLASAPEVTVEGILSGKTQELSLIHILTSSRWMVGSSSTTRMR